ncbi:hypothetical protein TNCV_433821 [Trichonephila clavipes]|nr:hypothetical protein TNCV_433821 [Trichonephila clavipes]
MIVGRSWSSLVRGLRDRILLLTDDFENRNLGCASILLSSIWDSDFLGFGNLGLREGRDFRRGGPMVVQEALAMERSLIGGWQRFLLGVWTVNSPQSHIVRVYDAGHGKIGVSHSAECHDGDWSSDGIREAWLWFFIWVESF